ncbi:unnamed protein product [Mytilus coruscus]|uniref:Retrotransposon gag domain-containing protein n=1 Tax=Mytilus coruscus TaxID=42192 RepID=A0A6J8A9D7_MYTCO|nr:unnamed protein product [Mytilus coruscus]
MVLILLYTVVHSTIRTQLCDLLINIPGLSDIPDNIQTCNMETIVNALENEKKVPALLTLLGRKTYGLLRNLTLPDKPASKSYDDIVKLLKDHLSMKPLIVAERFRFYKRYQIQGETVNRYVAELRKFAEYCEFWNLNESLREQFVVGLKDEQTQKKLLTVSDLTFVKAIELL